MRNPCKNCPDRFPGCHGEKCQHGWMQYYAQLEEARKKRLIEAEAFSVHQQSFRIKDGRKVRKK